MSWLENLRGMKERSGLTSKQLAEKAGLPAPTVEKIFCGATKDPRLPTMQQLVRAMGCTLDELYAENVDAEQQDQIAQNILTQLGIIPASYSMTDADNRFIESIEAAVSAWFADK